MTDPDLTLRLLTDPGSPFAPWLDFLKTMIATLLGALLAFWATRAGERARAAEVRRTIAAAAAAELKASISSAARATRAAATWDPDHNKDTIDYGALPDDPTPLVRAAFEQAGQFPPTVAVALARYTLLQKQFRQHLGVLQTMRERNLLTVDKEKGRRAAMFAIALEMRDALYDLEARLRDYVEERRKWRLVKRA